MASDALKQLSEKQVQGWYERLGRKVSADAKTAGVSSPLSGAFLLQYIGKNGNAHLTVPNPDYQSKENYAVAPKEREIRVYHSNAIRLEKAGLAQPFKVRVKPWLVKQASVTGAAEIDPKKKLS